MTINARLVSIMGGKIWIESEPGRGSKFHFAMPLGLAILVVTKPIDVAPPEFRDVKILVVDDNRSNRRILDETLRRWKMKTTLVESGEQALTELTAARQSGTPYRLVLTDMHMPRMDGFELVGRIRHKQEISPELSPQSSTTAVIMMFSSAVRPGDATRRQELGIAAFLLKPIRQSELHDAIARVLGAHQQKDPVPLVAHSPAHDSFRPATSLRVLVADDSEPAVVGAAAGEARSLYSGCGQRSGGASSLTDTVI